MVFAESGETISGGNFHGEYPAKVHTDTNPCFNTVKTIVNHFQILLQALDYLAIGVHELANMSERRIERLTNPGTNIFHAIDFK